MLSLLAADQTGQGRKVERGSARRYQQPRTANNQSACNTYSSQ
jgi:hypothetical protein